MATAAGIDALLAHLRATLPPGSVLEGEDAKEKARTPWCRTGTPRAVLRPSNTAEVAAILRACHAAGQPVVPWGGKTGVVDGTWTDGGIGLMLERMNRIEELDVAGRTMTVEAGVILQTACEAAEARDLFFGLDLGSRGSATIGGAMATNAGGNRVIRYGMMRDMVLGLEAVLADGTVLSSLNHTIKNNAGYDLKNVFIGSEGTLGVVTRAVLRLRPRPSSHVVAFVAVDSFAAVLDLLRHMEGGLAGMLSAFEVMWADYYRLVTTPPANNRPPIPPEHPYYVLLEAMGNDQAEDEARFERVLGAALEAGIVADAVVAKSAEEGARLWALRDDVAETRREGPVYTFDISLRHAAMEDYIAEVGATLRQKWPGIRFYVFGHLGDGNLHLNLNLGSMRRSREAHHAMQEIVYGALRARGGSISAEHGIGIEKRAWLAWSRGPEEIALMKAMKAMLDPRGILNPDKVFMPAAGAR